MEQEIAGQHVYDALTDVVNATKLNNIDFELYQSQKQYKFIGEDIVVIGNKRREVCGPDKYKNIHTAQKALEMQHNKSWYFFIDIDTYVFWSSLIA